MSTETISTRQKILQIIEEMEMAENILTISGVAKEANISNATIHNRYPDLADRIRSSSGIVREKNTKMKLAQQLGTLKEEMNKRARLRIELNKAKDLLNKVNSINASLQLENISLKAQLEEVYRKTNIQIIKTYHTV